MPRSSRWLIVYIFAVSLAAGVWVATDRRLGTVAWIVALGVALLIERRPFALEPAPAAPVRPHAFDVLATTAIALPAIVFLTETWREELPTLGDQFIHNAYALDAYEFWFPWAWLVAVVAMVLVARKADSRLPLAAFAALAVLALLGLGGGFATYYPALLHFASVPFRAAMRAANPLDVERLVNLLAIPGWLLVLRPRLLGRHVDVAAAAAGALLFWQKDVVYYVASGYQEAWGLVLLLTAGEHLLRFGDRALWRPLLLIGTAAVIKEQMVLALPFAPLIFFPRRNWWSHLTTLATAAIPFALYAAHPTARIWRGTAGLSSPAEAFGAAHVALWTSRVALQFGIALPLAIVAVAALLLLAFRSRGGAAVALIALANVAYFYFARATVAWAGVPRLHLVPLALAALALGVVLESYRRVAFVAVALIAAANAVPLFAFLRLAAGPSDNLNFVEHSDAPVYYPIREALERQRIAKPGDTVEILNDAKWLFSSYYPGLFADQYPDLAARYRVRLESFQGMPARCGCNGSATKLAVFIRFRNLGANIPARPRIEAEAAQCRAAMEATCSQRVSIFHDRTLVALLGR